MYLHTSQKCWEWGSEDLDNKQDMQGAMAIKGFYQYKWPTYYSCHYCINSMKEYACVAKNTEYSILQHGIQGSVCNICVKSS